MIMIVYFNMKLHQMDVKNDILQWRPKEKGLHETTKRFYFRGDDCLVFRLYIGKNKPLVNGI